MLEDLQLDRRKFFKTCAALLTASVVPVGCNESGLSTGSNEGSTAIAHSKAAFAEIPSTVFSVSHDTYGVIDMTLIEVDNEVFSPEVEQFSICLQGPISPEFNEGTYTVYNDELGEMQLFLQPSESSSGEMKYRAMFSLLNT